MMGSRSRAIGSALGLWVITASRVLADGIVIDKVYHPYVDAQEKELEYRLLVQDTQPGRRELSQLHQFSLGTSIGQQFFTELYVIGSKNRHGTFETEAMEAELKWQLTEQGEYGIDWGLLFEYEHELRQSGHEVAVGLLAEKELGQWSAAANFMLVNEWGSQVRNEVETRLGVNLRYRYSELFEPGIELYAGQGARGIGPVLQGTVRTGTRKSLHWEFGGIVGIGKQSPDMSWRMLFEYEF